MNNKNVSMYKKLVLASCVAALTACGGNGGSSGNADSSNTPPVLDLTVVPEPGAALVTPNPNTMCIYEDTEAPEIQQLTCTFSESDLFNSADGLRTYYDVDMLAGVMDADEGDALSITNLRFIWEGVDCWTIRFNSVLLEDNPQCGTEDTVDALIAELPDADQVEYDGLTTEEKLDRFRLRSSQKLPDYTDRGYAFDRQTFSYRVTPSNMRFLLRDGEYTAIQLQYDITDGVDSITRRLYLRVYGENELPENTNLPRDDENYSVDFSFGKDPSIQVDLLEGFVDSDIEIAEAFVEARGPIENLFSFPVDYQEERLRVGNFRLVSDTGQDIGYTFNFNTGELTLAPGDFLDSLAFGEEVMLSFEYDVFDGDPIPDRAIGVSGFFDYIIVGTDPDANPPYFRNNLFKQFGGTGANNLPWGSKQTFSLLEGVRDPDGDVMSVSSFDDGGAADYFGVDTSAVLTKGEVTIDSVAFFTIPEGETRDLVFTYVLTDGALEASERTLTVRLIGHERNILKNADVDYGFESGVLNVGPPAEIGQWSYGWSADGAATDMVDVGGVQRPVQAVLDASSGLSPYEGDYFLYTSPGWSTAVLRTESMPLGAIFPGARYYVNFWAKASAIWSSINVGVASSNDWNAREITMNSPINGTSEWKEHTGYFIGDPAFTPITPVSLWFQSEANNEVLYDSVSIVRYFYDPDRDFAGPQLFEGTSTGAWEVLNIADGNANITSAAGFNEGQGLEIDTTGQTDAVVVRLPADAIPDGAIQQGGRYRVEFDMRFFTHPEDGNGTSNATVTAAFYDEASPATRMELNNFLVNSSWKKMDFTFNVDVLNASDVDWMNTDVGFQIEFDKPNQTFYIDNVRIYQVP